MQVGCPRESQSMRHWLLPRLMPADDREVISKTSMSYRNQNVLVVLH
jgi:hypothetical protein